MKRFSRYLLWFLEGMLVGVGAILPGISGGSLLVVFGMYLPILEVIAHPRQKLSVYWRMLLTFVVGGGVGFVGLSRAVGALMSLNEDLVVCVFIGFIVGTLPELWREAGKEGRGRFSYLQAAGGFLVMLGLLLLFENLTAIRVEESFLWFLLCGVLWGLSFIVPGLSSSTLIMFLGLYGAMSEGIGSLSLPVVLPLGLGALACILLLARPMSAAFHRRYAPLSHIIFGAVIATTVMIFPFTRATDTPYWLLILVIPAGAVASFLLTRLCGGGDGEKEG